MSTGLATWEVQAVGLHHGTELHVARVGEEVLLSAEAQLSGDGHQVADGLRVVGIHHLLSDTDDVGVVVPICPAAGGRTLIHLLVDKVVEGLSLWDIGGVQPHDGGKEGAVPRVHQIAGVIGGGEGVEVVHRGHLVLDGDRDAMAVLHQLLDHAVDQLYLGELALIEEQAGGALGQEGVHAQARAAAQERTAAPRAGHPAAPGRWLSRLLRYRSAMPISRSRTRAAAMSTPVPPRMACMSSCGCRW